MNDGDVISSLTISMPGKGEPLVQSGILNEVCSKIGYICNLGNLLKSWSRRLAYEKEKMGQIIEH